MLQPPISMFVAALCSCFCALRDSRRRQLPSRAGRWIAAILAAAFIAAGLCQLLPSNILEAYLLVIGVSAIGIALIGRTYKAPVATVFDIAAPAIAFGYGVGALAGLVAMDATMRGFRVPGDLFRDFEILLLRAVAAFLIFLFLWKEGRAAMQWQRPNGLVTGEFLVLSGATLLVTDRMKYDAQILRVDLFDVACLVGIAVGLAVIALTLIGYFRRTEEHRILDRVDLSGQAMQPEYTPPTPECPNPQRWRMYDSMTAEVETLQFLKTLMTTMKPNLVVETGSFAGMSTVALAEGIAENGFGRIVTCELDERVFRAAKERIEKSGLAQWVDYRNESSLQMTVDGAIDVLFSDSEQSIREHEVRRFLPQMSPNGLILIHDAASCYDFVRKGALKMEQEGLISVVLMPTARGLVIAQKREGRR